jgi:hypothetical protein
MTSCSADTDIRELADKNYELLKSNPRHPSLHFKKLADLCSVRVGATDTYTSRLTRVFPTS